MSHYGKIEYWEERYTRYLSLYKLNPINLILTKKAKKNQKLLNLLFRFLIYFETFFLKT